jgi:Transposase DDE domain/Insertion element 4 transposase N-terminal
MAHTISTVSAGSPANDILRQLSSRLSEDFAHELAAASRLSGPPRNRRLPRRILLGFQIASSLHSRCSLTDVFAQLLPGAPRSEHQVSASVITQGRARLGWLPFRKLAAHLRRLTTRKECPSAFYRGYHLLAIDATTLTMPDTPANAKAFGYSLCGQGRSHTPLLRLVALIELGTHTFLNWTAKPIDTSEVPMALHLIPQLKPRQLLLHDAGYHSFSFYHAVRKQGAHLLGRVSSGPLLTRRKTLADGSYSARIYPTVQDRLKDRNGLDVRVIEYRHNDPKRTRCQQRTRLVTTLLNCQTAPARELVELYHFRWEQELAFRELKTYLADQRTDLRSKTPVGVLQDVWGLMIAHGLLRSAMTEAGHHYKIPPHELSFLKTLRIVQRHIRQMPADASHPDAKTWWAGLLSEIASTQQTRRNRIYPRVMKAGRNKFPSKKPHHKGAKTKPFKKYIRFT